MQCDTWLHIVVGLNGLLRQFLKTHPSMTTTLALIQYPLLYRVADNTKVNLTFKRYLEVCFTPCTCGILLRQLHHLHGLHGLVGFAYACVLSVNVRGSLVFVIAWTLVFVYRRTGDITMTAKYCAFIRSV